MRIKEALAGFEKYLEDKGYAQLSRQNYLRYVKNTFPADVFQHLPFENIFDYKGNLHFLTMGDYLQHYPEKFAWEEYVLSLKIEALNQRVLRILWEGSPAGKALRCLIRYLHEDGFLVHPFITRRYPKWKREVENLISNQSAFPRTLKEGFGCYLKFLLFEQNLTDQGLQGQYHQLSAALNWLSEQQIQHLTEVDYQLVNRFLEYREFERDNNLTTLYHSAYALKKMFAFFKAEGYLSENPLVELRVKKSYTITAQNVPTPSELEALLETAQLEVQKQENKGHPKRFLALRNRALLCLLCTTGIRSSELLELTLEHLDYSQGCLLIYGKGNRRYAKKVRRIFLEDEATVDALAEYLQCRPKGYGNRLFLTKNGLPMAGCDLLRVVSTYTGKARLKNKYCPHKLRAGFASLMIAQGIDPLTLKELMGHDSLQTTLKCYVNLEEDQLRQVWKNCNPLSRLPGGEEDDC